MSFRLRCEEQGLLRDTVLDFAHSEILVAEELDREKRFPYEIVARMGELGLMEVPFPEEGVGSTAAVSCRTCSRSRSWRGWTPRSV